MRTKHLSIALQGGSLLPPLFAVSLAVVSCGGDPAPPVAVDEVGQDVGLDTTPDAPDVGTDDTTRDATASDTEGSDPEELDSGHVDLGNDAEVDVSVDVVEDTGSACVPLDPAPPSDDGRPMDGWRWEHGEVLFPDLTNNTIAPALAWSGERFTLVFTVIDGADHALWGSSSVDGASWETPAPLVGIPDDVFNAYPDLSYDEDGYTLWWVSGGLNEAHSTDGQTWTVTEERIFTQGDAGDFDQRGLLYPDMERTADGWSLIYTGWDGATYRIGEATRIGDGDWTRRGPILEPLADAWDNTAVAQGERLSVGDTTLLWYGGYDTSRTNPGPWRVGLAALGSSGPARRGLTLPLRPGDVDAWSTRDPAVVATETGLLMVYVGMAEDSQLRLITAWSESCVAR